MKNQKLLSKNSIKLDISFNQIDYAAGIDFIVDKLDKTCGMYLSSGVDYPGRYSRWELGFLNPPLEFIAIENSVGINSLNPKGDAILELFTPLLSNHPHLEIDNKNSNKTKLKINIKPDNKIFPEEKRSLQPSVVSVLRCLLEEFEQAFKSANNTSFSDIGSVPFGFYGAFGYELLFQFEKDHKRSFERCGDEKLFHLFFVDNIYLLDKRKEKAYRCNLDLSKNKINTKNLSSTPYRKLKIKYSKQSSNPKIKPNISAKKYENFVIKAKDKMRQGEIFEVVPSRKFLSEYSDKPSILFKRMQKNNPSPYEFYCQFNDEQLIGTSPEMFVRVTDKRIESCPISGTIKRGDNPIEDSKRIQQLLNSYKDEVELTMCTDVDRNDKSRVCIPGSIKLLARRSIEAYANLFHTVDHVEGTLRKDLIGLDGFLSHMWAVTLTGAPKKKATQIIEELEQESRYWYGGAVGALALNGDINSCITIRTIRLKDKLATYQSGASLVWDSNPQEEAQETTLKSGAFSYALGLNLKQKSQESLPIIDKASQNKKIIIIDYEDSFVNTLAEYFRRLGPKVSVYRHNNITIDFIKKQKPSLVVHSPGPGFPKDFNIPSKILQLFEAKIPQFGVCLGHQAIVEAFGGKLKLLKNPTHGKKWQIQHDKKSIFKGLEQNMDAAAYHSIVANPKNFPKDLIISATNQHGDIMALRHKSKLICSVQFHPESILTMENNSGLKLIYNLIKDLK